MGRNHRKYYPGCLNLLPRHKRGQPTITFTWPAKVMEMTPPYEHIHLDDSVRAGMFARRTVGAPGAQGLAVTGTQGVGVKTPLAADVAEAVVGFDMEVHIAKEGIFTTGL